MKKSRCYQLRKNNKPLSYTHMRAIVIDAFERINLPESKFGLYSLRASGATAAANSSVPNKLFKRHGRWRSDRAKDGYVKDNVKALLSVSHNLGIENDSFLNSALQRFSCKLYYRFGSFLAPLSVGIITSRHYLSERNKNGEHGTGDNKNGGDEKTAD